MCYQKRDAKYAAVCKERDELKRELAIVRAERDAAAARVLALEQSIITMLKTEGK